MAYSSEKIFVLNHKFKQVVGAVPVYTVFAYPGSNYEKQVPTEDTISLVYDSVLDLYNNFTLYEEVDLQKLQTVMCFISENIMFKGQNKLPEWESLFEALKMHQFEYAYKHPCLWNCKKRLMFFYDVYSLVTSGDKIVRAAMISIDMFDDDWRGALNDPDKAPLKSVFAKYGNVLVTTSDASCEEKRWAEGGEMISFMKNCVDHLTEVEIGRLKERCYSHIDFMRDYPLYEDIEFFHHMATHFLYPKLWIELYTALYIGGYNF